MQSNTCTFNKEYKKRLERKYGICSRCQYHKGDNYRRQVKADKYKSQRKGRI